MKHKHEVESSENNFIIIITVYKGTEILTFCT